MDTSDFKESYKELQRIKDAIIDNRIDEALNMIDIERDYIKTQLSKEGIEVE